MLIGIDASRIENNNKTGTENYGCEVTTRLLNMDQENNYILYSRKQLPLKLPPNAKNKILKFPLLWTQIRLSAEMIFNSPDVLFVPAHTVPVIHPQRTIAVIHGLEYEYFPETYSFFQWLKDKIGAYLSAKLAKIIITPSENTRNDLIRLYKINPEKIKVVYPGISPVDSTADEKEPEKNKIPYLLFIGRIERRKNIINIVKAFEKIKADKQLAHKLILAGKKGYGFDEIIDYIDKSRFKREINVIGYVSEREKDVLLRGASAFIFPTLYEGFGFPILEAMDRKAPVVASNKGSAPEIAGGAALLVDPDKIDNIADSIYKIITDKNLALELIKKGRENIKRFKWDKSIARIFEIITRN